MKNFKSLTTEELKKVFKNNEKLRCEILSAAHDDVNCWINEYMNCFDCGTLEYNIGYPGDYIRVKNKYDFIQGLKQLQKDYCYLSTKADENIEYCELLMNRYDNLSYSDYKNTDRLAARIDELISELKDQLLKVLATEFNYYYDDVNLCNYFIEIYADNMMGNYYIDDNYILFQHIEYEKSYK